MQKVVLPVYIGLQKMEVKKVQMFTTFREEINIPAMTGPASAQKLAFS